MLERITPRKVTTGAMAVIAGVSGVGLAAKLMDNDHNDEQPACVQSAKEGDSLAGFQSKLFNAGDKNVGSMTVSNGTEIVHRNPQVSEFMIAGHVSESTCKEIGGIVINSTIAQTGHITEAVQASVSHSK